MSLFGTEDAFSGTPAQQPSVQTSPSSLWTNSGEDSAVQPNVGNQAPQAGATTANSAPWSAQTIDLMPALSSSISVAFPGDYSANTGDFLLVSVAVQGIAGDFVCTPTNWHAITASTSGSGGTALTQASFWTTLSDREPGHVHVLPEARWVHRDHPSRLLRVLWRPPTTGSTSRLRRLRLSRRPANPSGTALTAPPNATRGRKRGGRESVRDRGRVQRCDPADLCLPCLKARHERHLGQHRRKRGHPAGRRESGALRRRRCTGEFRDLDCPDSRSDAVAELVDHTFDLTLGLPGQHG